MSQDPFHRDSNVPTAMPEGTPPPPPKKRRNWLRVLLVLFGGGFLTLLICCGAGAYLVQNYGGAIFDPVRKELNQMTDLRSEVGEIQSLNLNFTATTEELKTNPEFAIFEGQSDRGPIRISAKMKTSGELEKVFLIMSDNSRKPIDIRKRVAAPSAEGDSTPGEPRSADADEVSADKPIEDPTAPPVENPAQ